MPWPLGQRLSRVASAKCDMRQSPEGFSARETNDSSVGVCYRTVHLYSRHFWLIFAPGTFSWHLLLTPPQSWAFVFTAVPPSPPYLLGIPIACSFAYPVSRPLDCKNIRRNQREGESGVLPLCRCCLLMPSLQRITISVFYPITSSHLCGILWRSISLSNSWRYSSACSSRPLSHFFLFHF